MNHRELLFDLPRLEKRADEPIGGKPRLRIPQRDQIECSLFSLDSLIPANHIARMIWKIVCGMDLSIFLKDSKAVEGRAGRSSIDPRVSLGLWILATLEGIGSARALNRYCHEHHAFIWMRGGVSVNYHTLSDFRNQGEKLEDLLTNLVASLIDQGVVSTESWAQDGMRVRANAGTGSYRRKASLQESARIARKRLRHLKKNAQSDTERLSRREKAAKERAATECVERSENALKTLKQLQKDIDQRKCSKKEKEKLKKKARASTTDPEAKKMKMPNGGYNPAYNVQYVTDTKSRIITGVQTVDKGSDAGLLKPLIHQVSDAYDFTPENWLVDGGYICEKGLCEAEKFGIKTFMPTTERTRKKHGTGVPLPGNSGVMHRWVQRMESEESKNLYKDRASSAEFSNASTRNKGFYQFNVRGRLKAQSTSLLFAITHNVERITSMIKSGSETSLSFT